MASFADKLYARLPVPLQHVAVTAFGVTWRWRRLGPGFGREVEGFLARERFSTEEWCAWQTRTLRELLATAVRAVPYYGRTWARLRLDEQRLARFGLEDLRELPFLEKDAARQDPDGLCVGGAPPRGAVACPTSGSTGTPVRTYFTNADFRRSLALRETRACRAAGVSYRLPRATFSGRLVVPDAASRGPFYRFNLVERQVYFSAFHVAPQNAAAYIDALRRHRIIWATGYAHSYEQLARMMVEQGIPRPQTLRAIITTSEKLTTAGRTVIERAFGCRVFEEYGTVEDAAWACEREDGRLYVSPDAGILELVRPDGTSIPPDSDEEGEVVATGFIRRSQPFIRYRVGDLARWDPAPSRLGLAMPALKEIVGRLEDVIVGPDGRRTVRFHGIFTELPGVREAQVVQERRDLLRIKVVPAPGYGPRTVEEIKRRIAARFTDAMHVEVEPVEVIPRTKAGKYRAVVNAMKAPTAEAR